MLPLPLPNRCSPYSESAVLHSDVVPVLISEVLDHLGGECGRHNSCLAEAVARELRQAGLSVLVRRVELGP